MGGSLRKQANEDFFQVVDGLAAAIQFVVQNSPAMILPQFSTQLHSMKATNYDDNRMGLAGASQPIDRTYMARNGMDDEYDDSEMNHLLGMTESKDVYNPQTYHFHLD